MKQKHVRDGAEFFFSFSSCSNCFEFDLPKSQNCEWQLK